MDYLTKQTPEAPWLFSEDEMTDMPDRLFAAEVTREKLFMNLQNELPYHLTVETTLFKETEKSIRIEQNIIVERPAHRMIILGRGGQMIKKIGQQSRLEISKQLNKKVNLFLKRLKNSLKIPKSPIASWALLINWELLTRKISRPRPLACISAYPCYARYIMKT